jgi:DNA-binding LacI/PurR family transcriptional regulator/AraC-like DNA-binding protein
MMTDRKRAQLLRGKRIAFLTASVHSGSSLHLWPSLATEAERTGVELFIFPGGRLAAQDPEERLRNRLFDLVSESNIDGIVSWASALGGFVGSAELDAFHARFAGLALVSMAHKLPGRPVVLIDAYGGMLPLLQHLHGVHGTRHIAYIRGPSEHEGAADRYRALLDYLASVGQPVDPRLITTPFSWTEGREAVHELLDGRGLMPGRDFDALLAASDLQMYDAVLAMQERGFSVPQDILVAGFNDSAESRILSPPLTTVRVPFAEQAQQAFSTLLALLAGESGTPDQILGTELVIRRSCSCASAVVSEAGGFALLRSPGGARPISISGRHGHSALRDAMAEAACSSLGAADDDRAAWIEPLIDDFMLTIASGDQTANAPFLKTLDRISDRLAGLQRDLEPWQAALTAIRRTAIAGLPADMHEATFDLVDRARVAMAEAAGRANAYAMWKTSRVAQIIRDLEKDLIRATTRAELGSMLAERLPSLGISAALLIEEDDTGLARVSAGFDETGQIGMIGHQPFHAARLLPPGLGQSRPGRTWIVEPLSAHGNYFGRLILSLGIPDGALYEELRAAVTSALQGQRALDTLRQARSAAEKAETLKTRFLANVSAEFRAPLRKIEEHSESIGKLLPGDNKSASQRILVELEHIRATARSQMHLTDDLLDLSRSDVGDLILDTRLVRLDDILDRTRIMRSPAGVLLPYISGDPARLTRLLSLLLGPDAPRDNPVSISMESAIIVLRGRRSTNFSQYGTDRFGHGDTLATRLAAAHSGILEWNIMSDHGQNWELRLPFPNLAGAVPTMDIEAGPVFVLSLSQQLPGMLANTGNSRFMFVDPRLALELATTESPSAIVFDLSTASPSDAEAVLALARNEKLARLPFMLFHDTRNQPSSPAGDACAAVTIVDAIAASRGKRATIHICDGNRERRAALGEALVSSGMVEMTIRTSDTLADIRHALDGHAILVIRSDLLTDFRLSPVAGTVADRPTIIAVCDCPTTADELRPCLGEPRTIVLNDNVFDDRQFTTFVAQLLDGRKLLPPPSADIVKKAILYLNLNLRSSISRWQVAAAVNVSEDYLTRIFHRELGISPWEYLSRLRIAIARKKLRDGTDSIATIALATGFADQAYFCRVFKNLVGCSPGTFRDKSVQ